MCVRACVRVCTTESARACVLQSKHERAGMLLIGSWRAEKHPPPLAWVAGVRCDAVARKACRKLFRKEKVGELALACLRHRNCARQHIFHSREVTSGCCESTCTREGAPQQCPWVNKETDVGAKRRGAAAGRVVTGRKRHHLRTRLASCHQLVQTC